ncbi:hypothetical protein [Ancylothrix sp. D3o]|nr:hypothetical protein [Ancylothrix sp. D3o]
MDYITKDNHRISDYRTFTNFDGRIDIACWGETATYKELPIILA